MPAEPTRQDAGLIRPVVTASGMDLESVRVTAAGRRRLLRVVVDSDLGVSLDDAAVVSRELSAVSTRIPRWASCRTRSKCRPPASTGR